MINKYPTENTFTADREQLFSGNIKLNGVFHLPQQTDIQFAAIYLAPDLIPQGKIASRFSIDAGVKKQVQKGKGEVFLNASDLLNTLKIKKETNGNGFRFISTDYYETQLFRIGYNYKF